MVSAETPNTLWTKAKHFAVLTPLDSIQILAVFILEIYIYIYICIPSKYILLLATVLVLKLL